MVQTNIPGMVGIDTTPSARLQEDKRIAALAKKVGIATIEDISGARREADLEAIGKANPVPLQQRNLLEEVEASRQVKEMAEAEADQADQIPENATPEEVARIMAGTAPSAVVDLDAKRKQDAIDRNRLTPQIAEAAERLGFPGVVGLRGLWDATQALGGMTKEGAPLVKAIGRMGKLAKWAGHQEGGQQGVGRLAVDQAQKARLLATGKWKQSMNWQRSPTLTGDIEITGDPNNTQGIQLKEEETVGTPLYEGDRSVPLNTTSIVLEVLGAGMLDKGKIITDPELYNIMGINAERHFINGMYSSEGKLNATPLQSDTGLDPSGEEEVRQYEIKKNQKLEELGKDIYREYKQTRAAFDGLATDAYTQEINDINPAVFTQLGGMAKEIYAKVNSDLIERIPEKAFKDPKTGELTKNPVKYYIKARGAKVFEEMYRIYSGLFATKEVKPQSMVLDKGVIAGEGGQITRKMTTRLAEEIGNPDLVFEAMENQSAVPIHNNQRRTRFSTLMFMLGIGHGGKVMGQADKNKQPLPEEYDQFVERNNKKNYYADMFKVGGQKFKDLQSEKMALKENWEHLKRTSAPEAMVKAAKKAFQNYKPKTILRLEQEKAINIQEAMLRWNGQINYLTYAVQLLTGRMHVQQTLYNPQGHPQIRNVVDGNNKFRFIPSRNTDLKNISMIEKNWLEGMSAALFEDPKVIDPRTQKTYESWKKEKSFRMPREERIRLFHELEATALANPNEGLYNQYVAWGKELLKITATMNIDQAANILKNIKNATSDQQVSQITTTIEQVYQSLDPLSEPLKVYLAKFEMDAVRQADYLMALAEYTAAKKDTKQFIDEQTFEMDGQTHGPTSMGMLFGSKSIGKRSGMITGIPFIQKLNTDEYKDLRDAMADHMLQQFAATLESTDFAAYREKVGDHIDDALQTVLTEAISDRENFLKKSPMTMGYGQDIESLKRHIEKTIFLSDTIKQIEATHKLKRSTIVSFLHTMLVDSIFQTMDVEAIQTMDTVKNVAWQSVLLNEMIPIRQPNGLLTFAAGVQYHKDQELGWRAKPGEITKSGQVTETTYKGEASAQAERLRPDSEPEIGGWTASRILAALVQAFDANMVATVFSNNRYDSKTDTLVPTGTWNFIKEQAKSLGAISKEGVSNPFVLQIFDAFLVDSATLGSVREAANKSHKRDMLNESAAQKVFDWYHKERRLALDALAKDTDSYTMLKDGRPDPSGRFRKIAELFSGERAKGTGNPYANLVKFIKKNLQEKWHRNQTVEVTQWDPSKNKMVTTTEPVKKETLAQWDDRKYKISKRIASQIEMALSSSPYGDIMSDFKQKNALTGQQVGYIVSMLGDVLNLKENISESEKNIEEAQEYNRQTMTAKSGNIDLG